MRATWFLTIQYSNVNQRHDNSQLFGSRYTCQRSQIGMALSLAFLMSLKFFTSNARSTSAINLYEGFVCEQLRALGEQQRSKNLLFASNSFQPKSSKNESRWIIFFLWNQLESLRSGGHAEGSWDIPLHSEMVAIPKTMENTHHPGTSGWCLLYHDN